MLGTMEFSGADILVVVVWIVAGVSLHLKCNRWTRVIRADMRSASDRASPRARDLVIEDAGLRCLSLRILQTFITIGLGLLFWYVAHIR